VERRIRLTIEDVTLTGTLSDNDTAEQIWGILPIETTVQTWGDELYFGIPLSLDKVPDARTEMETGELAYWPQGNAFCIFFGPTPASQSGDPRAASAVNPFGSVEGNTDVLRGIPNGTRILVEAVGV
jgi:hypothetical protein